LHHGFEFYGEFWVAFEVYQILGQRDALTGEIGPEPKKPGRAEKARHCIPGQTHLLWRPEHHPWSGVGKNEEVAEGSFDWRELPFGWAIGEGPSNWDVWQGGSYTQKIFDLSVLVRS